MSTTVNNHALVFGASGIIGWAVINALLNDYPNEQSFTRVTALTNRPLSLEETQWPPSTKLQHVTGLDLLQGSQTDLENELLQRVQGIESVTVVYFFAYLMDLDSKKEIKINTDLLQRAITATEKLCPRLRFVVVPFGIKIYGAHLLHEFPWKNELPLREDLPRIPEPHGSQLFYHHQLEILRKMSTGKAWTFSAIIPDAITGFVPNDSFCCLAQIVAIYLSLCREMYGAGAKVVFPGTMKSWEAKNSESSQDIIARFAVFSSLHPEVSAGQTFNAADSAQPCSWSIKWPILCEYFGLEAVPPTEGPGPDPEQFIGEHHQLWGEMERKYGLQNGRVGDNPRSVVGASFICMRMFDFDRHLDLTKMHRAWGDAKEEIDVKKGWFTAFDRFRKAKVIP